MTLPTGAISFSDINTELGLQATAPLTLDANLVRLVASVGGTGVQTTSGTPIALDQLQGHAYGTYQNNTSVSNVNLVSVFTAAGHYAAGKTYGAVILGGSSIIGASNTASYGFTVQGANGDLFAIQNSGYIVGAGGIGGNGAYTLQGGYNGGNAFYAKGQSQTFIQLQNSGVIGAGGGGGSGGNWAQDTQNQRLPIPGGGGGGGAGYIAGTGGAAGQTGYYGAGAGASGTLATGGGGGGGGGQGAQAGGTGGNLGQAGQYAGTSGGSPGLAVVGTNWFVGGVSGTVYGSTTTS